MPTYNLSAADLITLLSSTVQPTTGGQILDALIQNGEFPGPIDSLYHVQTDLGPSGGSALPAQDDTIASGTELELITLPTSTAVTGSIFPAPTIGPASPVTNFSFLSPGGVVIGAGDQAVNVTDTGPGNDTLVGGAGFERLAVTGGANLLIGGSGHNTLAGGSGADTLIGGGRSLLVAGTGNEKLIGGTIAGAADTLVGGLGDDMLSVTQGDNRLVGGAGLNTLMGGAGDDTLIGGGLSSLLAGAGQQKLLGGLDTTSKDTLTGGSGKDVLVAYDGANSLTAGSGDNTLRSLGGDNTLGGGSGHARLVVAASDETLNGGTGDDTMVVTTASTDVHANFGAGFTRFIDTITSGMNVTIAGGTGDSRVLLGVGPGTDSITSGTGAMSILSSQSADDLIGNTSTAVGGAHTLSFKNGQTIVVNDANSNITIHFQGGGSTTV